MYKLSSGQFDPYSHIQGKTVFEGLPEQVLKSGIGEREIYRPDWPSGGERLRGEQEINLAEGRKYVSDPTPVQYRDNVPETALDRALPQEEYQQEHARFPPYEHEIRRNRQDRQRPLLEHLRNDYATVVLLMRWIEFLLERVKRNMISALLEYYQDIGWISAEVKSEVMAYARGEVQDVNAYEPELDDSIASFALDDGDNPVLDDKGTTAHPNYRSLDDWKLSAEDHLKSMLFIKKMAGCRINKDELNALEQDIIAMKYSLRRYHEV